MVNICVASQYQSSTEHCHPVMFGSSVTRYWLILQSKQILQGVTWQKRCANSLSYSPNNHKWSPALQCKCCDLVKWNNKTGQWHFVDILYIRRINRMVKVLFKVHFKCLVQGSATLARSAMNGSITSGSNNGNLLPTLATGPASLPGATWDMPP